MKKTVSVFLIVFLTTFSIFPWSKDKYSKIADKAVQEIKQNETSDDAPSQKESGLTVKDIIEFGVVVVETIDAGRRFWNKFSKDKYKKVAEKAFEAAKEME